MKALITTLIMAIIALVASGVAWVHYPKTIVQKNADREKLLVESELFESGDVRRVKIKQFEDGLKEFEFAQIGGSWVIPGKGNYPASNAKQIATALDIMLDRKVLEMVSDEVDDHEKYGVVDFDEASGIGTGVGTSFEFEGRNRAALGKLIVGKPGNKEGLRYVRLADQPHIYLVEFKDEVLTTRLADWTDGDLLRIATQPDFVKMVDYIDVDQYFLQTGSEKKSERRYVYRVRIRVGDAGWVYDAWIPGEDKALPEEPTIKGQPIDMRRLGMLVGQMTDFAVVDVERKQPQASAELAAPKEGQAAGHFDGMKQKGFLQTGFENGQHQFDGSAGEIKVAYKFGLQTHLHIGNIADATISGDSQINRYLLVTADVDEKLVPLPEEQKSSSSNEEPKAEKDDAEKEEGEKEEGDLVEGEKKKETQEDSTDEEKRAYQSKLNDRKRLLDAARQQAKVINQTNSDWIYIITEDLTSRLFPSIDEWKAQ